MADAPPNGLAYHQSVLFLPSFSDSDLVYMFNIYPEHLLGSGSNQYEAPENLYMGKIKLHGANNQPQVILKNDSILHQRLTNGHLTATKTADGKGWWLLCHEQNTDLFNKVLITCDTMLFSTQNIGSTLTNTNFAIGNACFSPDGNRYAMITGSEGNVDVYDFNRCTGELSNLKHDSIDLNYPNDGTISCAFSPSGRFLYVNTLIKLFQYDLANFDLHSSRILIDTSDHYDSAGSVPGNFGYLALAPNNKIYLSTWNGQWTLHEINYPDSIGKSCHFVQHFLGSTLPSANGTLPNVVNYDLAPSPIYTADAGADKHIYFGASTMIGIANQNGVTYQWTPTAGLDNPTIAQPTAKPEETTTYYLTITDANGLSGCNERLDTMIVFVTAEDGCPISMPSLIHEGDAYLQLNQSEPFDINCFNMLGQLVYVNDDYKGEWKPEVRGMYLVKVRCANGSVSVRKLVVE